VSGNKESMVTHGTWNLGSPTYHFATLAGALRILPGILDNH
jgi:hypothetical protein